MTMVNFNLDLAKHDNFAKAFTARQGDAGEQFQVTLFDNQVPYVTSSGDVVSLRVVTPTGKFASVAGTIVGNKVTFTLNGQITSEAGYYKRAYVVVSNGSTLRTTQDLVFFSLGNSDINQGQADYYVAELDKLLQQLNEEFDEWLAEREQDYSDILKVGKNLFDPSKVQVGVYYDSLTGEKISNQSYSSIELDVNAGQYLMFQTGERLRPFRHIASYDASDNFIAEKSFNNRGSSTAPWQIPAGVATIRATFVASYLDMLPYAFYGQSQSEYVPFGFTLREDISLSDKKISEIGESEFNGEKLIADKSIPLAKLSSVETGKNIFDKENYNSGYVEKNGTIVANALLYYTAKIPISLNQSVSVLGRGNKSVHMRKICAYDKDGNALSAYGFDKTPDVEFKSTYTNTTPDVTHIVVSFSNNMANLGACLPEDLMISYGTVPTNFEEYMLVLAGVGLSEKQIAQVGVSNNLKGKVIKNAGDSIAAGDGNANKGYAEIFAEMFGCNCIDYAKGGATITKALNPTNNICSQIDTIMSDGGSEPDFLLINGRTNDMNSTYVDTFALGTITSGYDTTNLNYDLSTFTGSLEYIFAKVRQSWGDVKILFVSVHKMGSRDLVKQETLHNRTLEVCKKWSIDVVNVYDEGELNTNLPSMYKYSNPTEANPLGDKTHPNQAGYEYAYIPLLKNALGKHLA